MDLQPTLTGTLVELRPLCSEDFDDLYAVASDPLMWEQHPAINRWKKEIFREFFDEALASGGALTVIDRSSGRLIGSTRFAGLDPVAGEVEIGWTFLDRSFWGGRYNGEMKRLMLDYAFGYIERVVLLVAPGNIRSQRAIEKIGAVPAGVRTNRHGRQGLCYEVTRGAESLTGLQKSST